MPTVTATPRNDSERNLLELVRHWEETYNTQVERMITECYAPNADVYFTGGEAHGHEQFTRLEKAIVGAAPERRMRVDRVLFAGDDTVVVEAVVLNGADPGYSSPFCAILTVQGGKIIRDHTYLEPARWPGIEAAADIVTPGGLGKST
ncbi:MAG: nuclear transport factor 2 family protein [Candidatus Binatia bacterium]